MPEDKDNLSFSQRYGYTPVKTKIQIESIDNDLRIGLWNILTRHYFFKRKKLALSEYPTLRGLIKAIWEYFFSWRLQSIDYYCSKNLEQLEKSYFSFEWFRIYEFIEFIVTVGDHPERFITECNQVLEKELSAYRFVGSKIVRITSEIEIKTIEVALQSPYGSVNQHLTLL